MMATVFFLAVMMKAVLTGASIEVTSDSGFTNPIPSFGSILWSSGADNARIGRNLRENNMRNLAVTTAPSAAPTNVPPTVIPTVTPTVSPTSLHYLVYFQFYTDVTCAQTQWAAGVAVGQCISDTKVAFNSNPASGSVSFKITSTAGEFFHILI